MIAKDYLDDRTLREVLPKKSDLIKEAEKKANREVANLSKERIARYKAAQSGENTWDFNAITAELLQILGSVTRAMHSESITPEAGIVLSTPRGIPPVQIFLMGGRNGDTEQISFSLPRLPAYQGPPTNPDTTRLSRVPTLPAHWQPTGPD